VLIFQLFARGDRKSNGSQKCVLETQINIGYVLIILSEPIILILFRLSRKFVMLSLRAWVRARNLDPWLLGNIGSPSFVCFSPSAAFSSLPPPQPANRSMIA